MTLLGGTFDYEQGKERLEEVLLQLENPSIWNDPAEAQKLGEERARLEKTVGTLDALENGIQDNLELVDLVGEEKDTTALAEIEKDLTGLRENLEQLEFRRMFSGEVDQANSFLDIQAGSGGTEAQDWAEMLLRMYLRWSEAQGFGTELIEKSEGEVAGIKVPQSEYAGITRMGTYGQKQECTAWLENLHSILETVDIPLLPRYLLTRRSMTA